MVLKRYKKFCLVFLFFVFLFVFFDFFKRVTYEVEAEKLEDLMIIKTDDFKYEFRKGSDVLVVNPGEVDEVHIFFSAKKGEEVFFESLKGYELKFYFYNHHDLLGDSFKLVEVHHGGVRVWGEHSQYFKRKKEANHSWFTWAVYMFILMVLISFIKLAKRYEP